MENGLEYTFISRMIVSNNEMSYPYHNEIAYEK